MSEDFLEICMKRLKAFDKIINRYRERFVGFAEESEHTESFYNGCRLSPKKLMTHMFELTDRIDYLRKEMYFIMNNINSYDHTRKRSEVWKVGND